MVEICSTGGDSGQAIVLVEYSSYAPENVRCEVKAGKIVIERKPENYVTGDGRSKEISWQFIEEITFDC